jgi:hypothetical protein
LKQPNRELFNRRTPVYVKRFFPWPARIREKSERVSDLLSITSLLLSGMDLYQNVYLLRQHLCNPTGQVSSRRWRFGEQQADDPL